MPCLTIRASLDDLHLKGALLDTYSKCGSIKDASKFFEACPTKDLIMMVGGSAMHGMAEDAIDISPQMLQLNINQAFLSLQPRRAGLVDEGLKHFKSIKDVHGIEPTMEHYACVADLHSRRGELKEAYDFIKGMPCKPNANFWGR